MSTEVREFLARAVPWPQLNDTLPSYVNIHWTVKNDNYDKPAWRGKPCQNVSEAVKAVEFALKGKDTKDIYVCMSTQSTFAEKVGAKGKFRTAVRSQMGAVALKSLFLDIDAKGEDKNSYATVADAASALTEFIKATGLPRPSIYVATGGGLHVYWTLARALLPQEWQPLARALAEATKQHGLKCDTQCTVDAARVLRVPGTYNRKLETPRPVRLAGTRTDFDYSVERIERSLKPYMTVTPQVTNGIDLTLFPRRTPIPGISELAAGIEDTKAPPVDLASVAQECPWLADVLKTGGKDVSNPLWNLTNLISVFTEGGRADAHRMGNKHPGYSQSNTDEQYDRKVRESQEKGLGWPSCQTISVTGATQCQKCPHFAKHRSPLNYATKTKSPSTLTPNSSSTTAPPPSPPSSSGGTGGPIPPGPQPQSDLPTGYMRGPDGLINKLVVSQLDGTTNPVPICDYRMDFPWIEKASPSPILHFDSVTERGFVQPILLSLEDVAGMSMRKVLQSQGMMLPVGRNCVETIGGFYVSWIKKLQETRDSVSAAPFGWTVKNGDVDGFVYNGRKWSPKGDSPASTADSVTGRHYKPTGQMQPWTDAAKLITDQGRPGLEVLLASAFAAPLIRFTGQPGVLLATYSSESGVGKTTTVKIAQAVWGNPIKAVQSLSDTQNSIMNKLGEINALPLYWDELKTEEDTKKFINITYQTTQGKEKSRMTSNVTQREPGTWQTLLVSASNESLLDFVVKNNSSTPAGLYRIFEYALKPALPGAPGKIEPSEASLITAKVHDNYGQVGLEYASYLGRNHEQIAQDVREEMKAIGKLHTTKEDERFWNALIATTLIGASYAKKLNFVNFDIGAMRVFLIEGLAHMRHERNTQPIDLKSQMNVVSIFAQFVNENLTRHTIWTNLIPTGAGKPAKGMYTINVNKTNLQRLEGLVIHIGEDDKLMRFSQTKLNKWLADNGYPRHSFLLALKNELGVSPVEGRLGAGTEHAAMAERLWHIDLAGTKLTNFIDQE